MENLRTICVVTGSRAEYGLLFWLLKEINADPALKLQLIVTGMHLSPEFGLTYQQIEADGFRIDAKVEMLLSSDTPVGITKSIGLGVIGFADALETLKPDILVLLGDRFEILAAAQAAMVARIPIAHLHGGELTEGAFDDSIRHAITKLAHWHFVAAEPYRHRVIQMGEPPDLVFNVGTPGLDHLEHLVWLSRHELETLLDMKLKSPLFLVTYHPVTLADQSPETSLNELLFALDAFPKATVVFTYPNADTAGRGLIQQIDQWVIQNQPRSQAFVSLGQQRYLSLMNQADVILGNSSSGITEAPALKKATVNIGDRQKGRLKATSVITVAEKCPDIITGIHHALSESFQRQLPLVESWYGSGHVSQQIKTILQSVNLSTRKSFYDIIYDL
ncbi:UDP-N-acetylglucosamine 2-epimerase [Candidatus Synechococcus calcipolaris G9]|uniref:UDP-N-acetylglucosamine 2-epimerase n=1 Tax=Candidatus Synechococcus calcipolaris G9 TaxID=1497997 RepID=A0ABT6EVM2_9SYNE|nr:UDP-N-acetylglucosamine 2-epimerase [Candidatus Synechococcus calcipolaris]MDG2989569.1 UDP-N-acetylglucosamine 2-epimerase [Candidatus Synechococcus calcipolaris G9]